MEKSEKNYYFIKNINIIFSIINNFIMKIFKVIIIAFLINNKSKKLIF